MKARTVQLICHESTPSSLVDSIWVDVSRGESGQLALHYRVAGNIDELKLPRSLSRPVRRDDLWKETCFEAFARPGDGQGYAELNFAPSTAWAGYWLEGYRADLQPLDVASCAIDMKYEQGCLDLFVTHQAGGDSALTRGHDWHVGLSAVIEDKSGMKSYWALAHPPGKPDFHDEACFALNLPAPDMA